MQKHLDVSTQNLMQKLGLEGLAPALFQRALTHCSSGETDHMERLEFLGDAVLGLVIAEYLHQQYPNESEGYLTRLRAHLVCRDSLIQVAEQWKLADHLRVGEGERKANGEIKSPSIAANAVEAVIGATFKTSNFDAGKKLILHAWLFLFDNISAIDATDAKSRLQEWTQGNGHGLPQYNVQDLGPDHRLRFHAVCKVQGKVVGKGQGIRKKHAELTAAQHAIITLGITNK